MQGKAHKKLAAVKSYTEPALRAGHNLPDVIQQLAAHISGQGFLCFCFHHR